MTPDIANLFQRLAEKRRAELLLELAGLDAGIRELNGQAPAPGAAAAVPVAAAMPPAEAGPGPLEARLEELRDLHGPVFVVFPTVPVQPGAVIQNGTARLEMLEPAALPDRTGKVAANRWFGKQVEA